MSAEEARARAHARWSAERRQAIEDADRIIADLEALPASERYPHYKDREIDHWQNKSADLELARWVRDRLIAAEEADHGQP